MPSWLGDTVMAMPTLRALRTVYPDAHISILIRRNLRPIVEGCPWINRILTQRPPERGTPRSRTGNPLVLARRLAAGRFDTAVLLPNSFRSALLVRLAGIGRRVGYDRDGRGGLLTDCLLPRRVMGRYVPVSARDYYLGIARYLGADHPDPAMQLFTRPEDDETAAGLLRDAGLSDGRKLVLLNPGANYGDAKMWQPERFAEVGDRCSESGALVAVSGTSRERPILDRVISQARHPILDLQQLGLSLSVLKSVIRRSHLLVTNDTGPRHVAAAFNVPVVTVFGPTDPAWSEIDFHQERQVRMPVWCGPCQKKQCPLARSPEEHQCMRLVTPEMVYAEAARLLNLSCAGAA